MKKIFSLIALMAICFGAQAQTLTQLWKTTDIPVGSVWGGDARQGVGINGTYYINNALTRSVEAYDQNGLVTSYQTGYGWSISSDDANNLIVRAGTPGAGASITTDSIEFNIIPANGGEIIKVVLGDLPNFPLARADYFGHVYGDVVNGTGYLLLTMNGEEQPYAIAFDHGQVDATKSFQLNIDDELMGFATQSTLGFSYVDDEGAQHATLMVRNGGKFQDITLNMSNGVLAQTGHTMTNISVNRGADAGGEIFKLGGKLYAVYPAKDPNGSFNYLDGIEIMDLDEVEVVASVPHTVTSEANKGAGNWVTVEHVDETTVNIYQYYVNGYVAMYSFEVEPSPTALENTEAEVKAVKVIENGQVIIIRDGVRYNVLGAQE